MTRIKLHFAVTSFLAAAFIGFPSMAQTQKSYYFFDEAIEGQRITANTDGSYNFHPDPNNTVTTHPYTLPQDTRFHMMPNGNTQIWVTDPNGEHPHAGVMFPRPPFPWVEPDGNNGASNGRGRVEFVVPPLSETPKP